MPAKGEPLSRAEADSLKEWIKSGAAWPENYVIREKAKGDGSFWSFQPLAKVAAPSVIGGPEKWNTNPIDRFILVKLSEDRLAPNPPASPEVFIRRATFDLTGLPPTPDEV
jgi:hypothetical protein